MADKQELRFKYIFPENYNPVYINGVFGGVSPNGEIVLNFTLERHPIPKSITHEINSDLTLGKEIDRDPNDYQKLVIRFVSSGIILNVRNARMMRDWLNDQVRVAEEIEKNIQEQEKLIKETKGELK